MSVKKVNENLKIGRRALDGENGIIILHDWQWDPKLTKWYLKICIKSTPGIKKNISNESTWYVVVDEEYPEGFLKIYPDAQGSLKDTFEHQSNNGIPEENGLWRKGNPCLDSQLKCLGRYNFDSEPIKPQNRLLWHVKRLINWIHAVNNDKLVFVGDPFELPEFNINNKIICAFSENNESYVIWKNRENKCGIVDLGIYSSNPSIYFIKEFKDENRKTIKTVSWGSCFSQKSKKSKKKENETGLWVLLDEIPVINKWQAPNFYGELFIVCKDLKNTLKKLFHNIRDEKEHILLLGFPVTKTIGNENSIIHWQTIKLPVLSPIKGRIPRTHEGKGRRRSKNVSLHAKGIRNQEHALWNKDKNKFTSKQEIEWLKSQNWDIKEITSRGQLSKDITSMKTLIIGAGTIGTSIAELLARTGTMNIAIMDKDTLEIGNLSRHSLGLRQIGKYKSKEIEVRLNNINPHIKVESINEYFKCSDKIFKKVNEFDLIIDCTSEDPVLKKLDKFKFEAKKIFVSVSVGVNAKRLFLSLQAGQKFNLDEFKKLTQWIEKERDEISKIRLPRDGIGCWSPIFPARYDDILLASCTAIKVIEQFITKHQKTLNVIYEYSGNGNIGYTKVE